MNTPLGYALFPLRPFGGSDGKKGKIGEGSQFRLNILWRGESSLWDPVCALVAAWAHLGCLGFRGRRALGALRLAEPDIPLANARQHFAAPGGVSITELADINPINWRGASAGLLTWYRSWRQHGQMYQTWVWNDKRDKRRGGRWVSIPEQQRQENRSQPGFRYARRDHNEGLDAQGTAAPNPDPENPAGRKGGTFRPALGLPIIQFFSSLGDATGPTSRGRATVNWEWNWDTEKDRGKGRFASPVLLRPHRDAQGNWHALVIFVEAHKWPQGKPVFLNGQPRDVSLELYEAMKADPALKPFP
jgi:hypothetical protein